VALGLAAGAYAKALDFSKRREQFGRPICEFQGIQWMLADMDTQIEAARLLIHHAASSANPFPDPRLAAQAKVFASEMAILTIGGGTAQILRTVIASRILERKLPQVRDGYSKLAPGGAAAE
jgi:alkylation response protein AidB-like acyl-CoA dehydrogenase